MRTQRGDQDFFLEFLQAWFHRSEAILHRLHHMSRDPSCEPQHRALVTEAMDHQGAYFSAKSDLAGRDATHALSPPWVNPMARALLWVGGWRPIVAFRLVTSTVRTSEEQARQMEEMKRITREEEVAVEKEMERVQLGIVGMVRAGTGTAAEAAVIGSLMVGMGKVAAAADRLRMEALTRVVGTLSPSQAVDFLAAVVELQLGLHMN